MQWKAVTAIKFYWPRRATLIWQRLRTKWVKMTHWAGLKWSRGWDKIKDWKLQQWAAAPTKLPLALRTFFIFLPLPSSPIKSGELYIFMFILMMRNKKGNDAWPSAECQQICISKKYCCDDYYFSFVQDSTLLLQLWAVALIPSPQFRMSILNCFIRQGHSSTQWKSN